MLFLVCTANSTDISQVIYRIERNFLQFTLWLLVNSSLTASYLLADTSWSWVFFRAADNLFINSQSFSVLKSDVIVKTQNSLFLVIKQPLLELSLSIGVSKQFLEAAQPYDKDKDQKMIHACKARIISFQRWCFILLKWFQRDKK